MSSSESSFASYPSYDDDMYDTYQIDGLDSSMHHESDRESLDQPETNDSLVATTTMLFNGMLPPELSQPSDVTFIVGEENPKIIPAHKFLLCIRSPVFHRMFHSQLAETNDSIRIPDLDPAGFENMLRYIYTDAIIEDFHQFGATFMAADKYLVTGLCDKLLKFSMKATTFETCLLVYDNYLQSGILERANWDKLHEMINVHAYLAFNSSDFLKIRKEALIRLLERNELLIDELDLFSACFRWLGAEAERQRTLANPASKATLFASFKHLIRFPLMSENEFFGDKRSKFVAEIEVVAPAKSGLFADNELQEFRRYYKSKDPNVLSINYNFSKRDGLRVAKLIYDWRIEEYRMAAIDEELPEDGDFVYLEDGKVGKDARLNQSASLVKEEKAKVSKWRATGDSKIANDSTQEDQTSEIRLFKVQKIEGNEEFDKHVRFDIADYRLHGNLFSNRKQQNVCYRKNGASHMAFNPISLKEKRTYMIDFKNTRHQYNAFANLDLRLDQVFAATESGEKKLDVRTKITRKIYQKVPAYQLYFLY